MTKKCSALALVRRVVAIAQSSLKPLGFVHATHVLIASPAEQAAELARRVVVVYGEPLYLKAEGARPALLSQKRVVDAWRESVFAVALAVQELARIAAVLRRGPFPVPLPSAFDVARVAQVAGAATHDLTGFKGLRRRSNRDRHRLDFTSRAHVA